MTKSVHDKVVPLWEDWKQKKDKKTLNKIFKEFEPMYNYESYRIGAPTIPKETIKSHMKVQTLKALDNYDPKQGKINTFVESYLQKTKRYVYTNQNIARIPEERIRKIGTFKTAKQGFIDKYNREPSDIELADELGWPLKQVGLLKRELRSDLISTDPGSQIDVSKEYDRFGTIYHNIMQDLDPQEQLVFQYYTGFNNNPVLSGNDIAKKMKVSPAQVSKIKNKIGKKIEESYSSGLKVG